MTGTLLIRSAWSWLNCPTNENRILTTIVTMTVMAIPFLVFLFNLSLITDAQEWRYFKSQSNVTTPMEEDMFIESNEDGKWKQILMRPKEVIHIPFKFQSFTADHSVHPQVSRTKMNINFKWMENVFIYQC